MSADRARSLEPGSEHYLAYVGPPSDYDWMGATQFRLLCALGLREDHRLLDFGCGSLRAGRLLIPYLKPDHYHGLEPNRWLIEDAIEREVGADLIRIKRPRFLHHDTFTCGEFGVRFDYIVAQSIFSHCGAGLIGRILADFGQSLGEQGIVAATFIHSEEGRVAEPGEDWVYPGCLSHPTEVVMDLIRDAGLHGCSIPWLHPRQTWWLLARHPERLPSPEDRDRLRGAVLSIPMIPKSP